MATLEQELDLLYMDTFIVMELRPLLMTVVVVPTLFGPVTMMMPE